MIAPQESSNCLPNFFVILSIPIIIFLSTLLAYFGLIPLKIEIHTLIMIGFIFFIFIFFIKHNANYAACSFRNSFYDIGSQLQEYLNKNLLQIGETKKSLSSIDAFLESYASNLRNDNFSSIATTVFPMLGILGTFISIAMSMPDFSVQDTTALDHEITVLLSGVGTAFYVSIYGIFLSLWWIFFEKRGISKLESTMKYINSLYSKYVWSQNELDTYKYGSRQLENQHLIQALGEVFTTDKVKALNEDYLNNFKQIVETTSTSFSTIANKMDHTATAVLETIEKINASSDSITATQNLGQSIQDFITATQGLDQTISTIDNKLNSRVNTTFEKIDKELSDVIIKLSDFAYLLDEHNEKILQNLEEYHREILKKFKR